MEIFERYNVDLINGLRNRSVYAFEFVFKSHYEKLVLYAINFVMNRSKAEDIVQDCFLTFWNIAPSLPEETDVKKYLYKSVKNGCFNYFKHLNVVDKNSNKLIESIIHSNTLSYEDNQEIIEKVRKCMTGLSSMNRVVLEKRILHGMSYKDIAQELGISEHTVHTHIKRAYKYFRENFPFEYYLLFLISDVPRF